MLECNNYFNGMFSVEPSANLCLPHPPPTLHPPSPTPVLSPTITRHHPSPPIALQLELLAAQQQDGDVLGVGSDMLTAGMAAAVGKPYNGGAGVQGPGWGSGDGSVRRGLAAAAAALEAAEASGRGREGSGSGVREGAGEGRGEGRGGRKGGVQFRSGELARGSGSSGGDKALRIPVGRDEEEQICESLCMGHIGSGVAEWLGVTHVR